MNRPSISPWFPVLVAILFALGWRPWAPLDAGAPASVPPPGSVPGAIAAVGMAGASGGSSVDGSAEALFRRALFDEEGRRQLESAIEGYEGVIRAVDEQRRLAATAVFRLGECYRKLGRTNDAVVQYQRVLRDFSAEEVLARLSRQNLTSLGVPLPERPDASDGTPASLAARNPGLDDGSQAPSTLSREARARQQELLQAELALLETERAEMVSKVQAGVASAGELRQIERQVLQLNRQLVTAEAGSGDRSSATNDPAGGDAVVPAVERAEIARLESLMANSPDLLSTPGPKASATPLHDAAGAGQAHVVRYLLSKGGDVDSTKAPGRQTPLMLAAGGGHKAVVEILLEKGANPNRADAGNTTPLFMAVRQGFREVARTLIAGGADVRATGTTDTVRWRTGAAGQGVQTRITWTTPLHVAARMGSVPLITELLAAGAPVDGTNSAGLTPLVDAVMARKAEAAEALLAGKADPNLGRMTPLSLAVTGSGDDVGPDLAMVRRLLIAGADVGRRDAEGFPPLLRAIAMASYVMDGSVGDALGVVRVLLEAKADPNQPRDGLLRSHEVGQTPLLHAVWQRNLKLTETLLDAGARIHEARSTDGRTPLHLATLRLDRPMVELLLARGADPRLKSGANQTPLDQIRNTSSGAAGTVGVADVDLNGPVTVQLTGPGFGGYAGGGASGDPANPNTRESRMESIQELLRTWQPPKP